MKFDFKAKLNAYTVVTGLLVVSLLVLAGISSLLFISSPEETEKALKDSKRVVYDVVEGKFQQELKPTAEESVKAAGEATTETTEHDDSAKHPTDATEPVEGEPKAEPAAAETAGAKPKIVMIITGVGISKSTTETITNLPSGITLAISPYSHLASSIIEQAKKSGRTFLVEVPMEPIDYPITDPGPFALLCKNQNVENLSRLEWSLTRIKESYGIMVPVETKFTECPDVAKQIFSTFPEKQMSVVMGSPSVDGALPEALQVPSLKAFRANVVVDAVLDAGVIDQKLAELETIAKEKGYAIGVAKTYPISLTAISKWAENIQDRGFKLAPLAELTMSATAEQQPAQETPAPAAAAEPAPQPAAESSEKHH